MNIITAFESLFEPALLNIATLHQGSGSHWQATTESGSPVVLMGEGKTGQKVLYNLRTGEIVKPAPNIIVHDVPL